jgi:hypothetical protein
MNKISGGYDKIGMEFFNKRIMEKARRFAFDLGGVIIERGAMENLLV